TMRRPRLPRPPPTANRRFRPIATRILAFSAVMHAFAGRAVRFGVETRAELPQAVQRSVHHKSANVPAMTEPPGIGTRAASTISATFILLLPALWNRFPLLEYDTGGYLARWFEGYLVPSRSTTYGLFVAAGWPLDFWPIVILQALASVWIIALLL